MPDDAVRAQYPVVDYDHNSRKHSEHWPEEYREMRAKTPRAWSSAYGGYWVATKYNDIIGIAQKPDAFTTHKTFDPVTGEIIGPAPPLDPNTIPPNIIKAQCQCCVEQNNGVVLMPTFVQTSRVKRKKIGPLETEWFDNAQTGVQPIIPSVSNLLTNLINQSQFTLTTVRV